MVPLVDVTRSGPHVLADTLLQRIAAQTEIHELQVSKQVVRAIRSIEYLAVGAEMRDSAYIGYVVCELLIRSGDFPDRYDAFRI